MLPSTEKKEQKQQHQHWQLEDEKEEMSQNIYTH
jgi:hypothetical protein